MVYAKIVSVLRVEALDYNVLFQHLQVVSFVCLIWNRTFTISTDWTSIYITKNGIWHDKKVLKTPLLVLSDYNVNAFNAGTAFIR